LPETDPNRGWCHTVIQMDDEDELFLSVIDVSITICLCRGAQGADIRREGGV